MTKLDARTSESNFERLERIVAVVLLALAAIVFFAQVRSIYVAPQPNSVRWFGDETWLMQEAKAHVATGVVHYPFALGTSLTESKGAVLGMPWLSSALYGIPVAVVTADPVDVGRTVTTILAALLAIGMFVFFRLLRVRMSLAALGVVLLVSDRSFLLTAHSARPDMLAGLVVLCVFAIGLYWSETRRQFTPSQWALIGALLVFLALTSSIHLLTLLPLVSLYFVWRLGAFRTSASASAIILGGLGMLAVLLGIYGLTAGSLTLFPGGSHHAQFGDVLSSIPILRPLSRSVQVANIVIRAKQFAAEAPQALIIVPLFIAALVFRRRALGAALVAFALLFCSWLLFQGAEVHYLMHIVPLMIFVSILIWSRMLTSHREAQSLTAVVVAGLVTMIAVRYSNAAFVEGTRVSRATERAVAGLFAAIAGDWQQQGVPLVLSEPPSLEQLTKYPLRISTDHFLSFPRLAVPDDRYLDTIGVDYVVLYNSPAYPKDRPRDDAFYRAVRARGTLIDLETGTLGDFGRSYFERTTLRDTLLLFRWPRQ